MRRWLILALGQYVLVGLALGSGMAAILCFILVAPKRPLVGVIVGVMYVVAALLSWGMANLFGEAADAADKAARISQGEP